MEQIKEQIKEIRLNVKERICNALTGIYRHFNNGLLPNYEEEEEVFVEGSQINLHLLVSVEVGNTYTEDIFTEKWSIDDYIVTLDNNLMFFCGSNELEWTEISTDELCWIAVKLIEIENKLNA